MITLLPFPNFSASLNLLDDDTLLEVRDSSFSMLNGILRNYTMNCLEDEWDCMVSWINCEATLSHYVASSAAIADYRGLTSDIWKEVYELAVEYKLGAEFPPLWVGEKRIHSNHRAYLLYKNPDFYKKYSWSEVPTDELLPLERREG